MYRFNSLKLQALLALGVRPQPKTKEDLKLLIKTATEDLKKTDLNFIDTSKMRSFNFLFKNQDMRGWDISKWDVSNARTMAGMFEESEFNGDISAWTTPFLEERDIDHYEAIFGEGLGKYLAYREKIKLKESVNQLVLPQKKRARVL